MKLDYVEVSGITRIVENHKVVWNRYRNRWVKYIGVDVKGGMSMEEMHEYLDNKLSDIEIVRHRGERYPVNKYRMWINRESINIVRNKV